MLLKNLPEKSYLWERLLPGDHQWCVKPVLLLAVCKRLLANIAVLVHTAKMFLRLLQGKLYSVSVSLGVE